MSSSKLIHQPKSFSATPMKNNSLKLHMANSTPVNNRSIKANEPAQSPIELLINNSTGVLTRSKCSNNSTNNGDHHSHSTLNVKTKSKNLSSNISDESYQLLCSKKSVASLSAYDVPLTNISCRILRSSKDSTPLTVTPMLSDSIRRSSRVNKGRTKSCSQYVITGATKRKSNNYENINYKDLGQTPNFAQTKSIKKDSSQFKISSVPKRSIFSAAPKSTIPKKGTQTVTIKNKIITSNCDQVNNGNVQSKEKIKSKLETDITVNNRSRTRSSSNVLGSTQQNPTELKRSLSVIEKTNLSEHKNQQHGKTTDPINTQLKSTKPKDISTLAKWQKDVNSHMKEILKRSKKISKRLTSTQAMTPEVVDNVPVAKIISAPVDKVKQISKKFGPAVKPPVMSVVHPTVKHDTAKGTIDINNIINSHNLNSTMSPLKDNKGITKKKETKEMEPGNNSISIGENIKFNNTDDTSTTNIHAVGETSGMSSNVNTDNSSSQSLYKPSFLRRKLFFQEPGVTENEKSVESSFLEKNNIKNIYINKKQGRKFRSMVLPNENSVQQNDPSFERRNSNDNFKSYCLRKNSMKGLKSYNERNEALENINISKNNSKESAMKHIASLLKPNVNKESPNVSQTDCNTSNREKNIEQSLEAVSKESTSKTANVDKNKTKRPKAKLIPQKNIKNAVNLDNTLRDNLEDSAFDIFCKPSNTPEPKKKLKRNSKEAKEKLSSEDKKDITDKFNKLKASVEVHPEPIRDKRKLQSDKSGVNLKTVSEKTSKHSDKAISLVQSAHEVPQKLPAKVSQYISCEQVKPSNQHSGDSIISTGTQQVSSITLKSNNFKNKFSYVIDDNRDCQHASAHEVVRSNMSSLEPYQKDIELSRNLHRTQRSNIFSSCNERGYKSTTNTKYLLEHQVMKFENSRDSQREYSGVSSRQYPTNSGYNSLVVKNGKILTTGKFGGSSMALQGSSSAERKRKNVERQDYSKINMEPNLKRYCSEIHKSNLSNYMNESQLNRASSRNDSILSYNQKNISFFMNNTHKTDRLPEWPERPLRQNANIRSLQHRKYDFNPNYLTEHDSNTYLGISKKYNFASHDDDIQSESGMSYFSQSNNQLTRGSKPFSLTTRGPYNTSVYNGNSTYYKTPLPNKESLRDITLKLNNKILKSKNQPRTNIAVRQDSSNVFKMPLEHPTMRHSVREDVFYDNMSKISKWDAMSTFSSVSSYPNKQNGGGIYHAKSSDQNFDNRSVCSFRIKSSLASSSNNATQNMIHNSTNSVEPAGFHSKNSTLANSINKHYDENHYKSDFRDTQIEDNTMINYYREKMRSDYRDSSARGRLAPPEQHSEDRPKSPILFGYNRFNSTFNSKKSSFSVIKEKSMVTKKYNSIKNLAVANSSLMCTHSADNIDSGKHVNLCHSQELEPREARQGSTSDAHKPIANYSPWRMARVYR